MFCAVRLPLCILKKIACVCFCVLVCGGILHAQGGFIQNKGQWNEDVLFRCSVVGGYVEITQSGYRVVRGFDLTQSAENNFVEVAYSDFSKKKDAHSIGKMFGQVYEVVFDRRNPSQMRRVKPKGDRITIYNYYQGNNPKKWASGCKSYQEIWIENFYPNIDIHYTLHNANIKYDLILHPGGKVSDITLLYKKNDKIEKSSPTELRIQTSPNYFIHEHLPLAYELLDEEKSSIRCHYVVKNNTVKFQLPKNQFDHQVVIDPDIIFSTFSGSKAHNLAYCSSFDRAGNFLGGSVIFNAGLFPVAGGGIGTDYRNDNFTVNNDLMSDVAFMKLSADGKDNLAATIIGSRGKDEPKSIKETPDGGIIIIGKTTDAVSFPSKKGHTGTMGGSDIFIVRLDATGALINARTIGGSGDEVALERGTPLDHITKTAGMFGDLSTIASTFNDDNDLIFTTNTTSTDFPIIGSPEQANNPTGTTESSGVLVKISQDLNTFYYIGYLGGTEATIPRDIEFNTSNKHLYIVGATLSRNLPSSVGDTNQGNADGYIIEVEESFSNQYKIVKSALVGTTEKDVIYNIAFDKDFYPYIAGTTASNNWPVTTVWGNVGAKQFIEKYKKDLSKAVYSTTFGPTNAATPSLVISAFLIDYCTNIYVSGWGGQYLDETSWKGGFPLNASDGVLRTNFDPNGDYYVIVLEREAKSLFYAGFLGATNLAEHYHFGENRFDKDGILYLSVCECTQVDPTGNLVTAKNYPIYPNNSVNSVWSRGIARNKYDDVANIPPSTPILCNPSFTKIKFDYDGVRATAIASQDGGKSYETEVRGCIPIDAIIADQSPSINKGKTFYWTFSDDGSSRTTNTDTVHHTYKSRGVYDVQLITENLDLCKVRDTANIKVSVLEGEITLGFYQELLDCSKKTLAYKFTNTSVATNVDVSNSSFVWNFGDGSPLARSIGTAPIEHIYAQPGDYVVSLKTEDPLYCHVNNDGDSVSVLVNVGRPLSVTALLSPVVCVNQPFKFVSTSVGTERLVIDWGDGSPTTTMEGALDTLRYHTYTSEGNYTIAGTSFLRNCPITTSSSFAISAVNKPVSDFDFNPKVSPISNEIVPNATVQFTNKGNPLHTAKWMFGDEKISPEANQSNLFNASHLYATSGEKTVTLINTDIYGCADTTSKKIITKFTSVLGIASGFSPNNDGHNDRIGVDGVGIKTIDWKIYDRQGKLVFTTTTPTTQWDGKAVDGSLAPTDTYFYSIEATFIGGQVKKQSGEITLIR